jgi:hypothetical protein
VSDNITNQTGENEDIKPTDLVIRVNTVLTNDPCALCGQPTDPTGIVCHSCGFFHAPALARLLDLASAANTFVRAEYEMFGVQSDDKPV